jgi:hypothetical protein
MKKIISPELAMIILLTILFAACKKEKTNRAILSNKAPVADAGKDTVITLPVNSILLDGSASTDAEKNIASYEWKLVYGPSIVNIAKPGSVKTMVEKLVKGIYNLELKVTDNFGFINFDNVEVTVWDPQHFNIKSVSDTTIQLPYNRAILRTVVYNIYNNHTGWKQISGPNSISITNQNQAWTTITNLVVGVYKFELSATYWNHLTDKDTMTVTVLPDNKIYTKEKLFDTLYWNQGEWGEAITYINNISSIIPAGNSFLVYFLNEKTTDWEIAIPLGLISSSVWSIYSCTYSLENNKIVIGFDYLDKTSNPKIKIVY